MKKLLHERLRDHDDLYGILFQGDWYSVALFTQEAQALADEIERYYIPRPRFEDGEAVQFGDRTDTIESIDALLFRNDGTFEIQHKRGGYFGTDVSIYSKGEIVKRPQPKVLDVDGVEIKVGDTVYDVKTGHESKVTSTTMIDSDGNSICCVDGCPGCLHYKPEKLTHKEPVLDADGVPIKVGDTVWETSHGGKFKAISVTPDRLELSFHVDGIGDVSTSWLNANEVTHKEPDSLEKLRDDVLKWIARYRSSTPYEVVETTAEEIADRLSALIERGA